MSIKIVSKNGEEHLWDDSRNLLDQLEDADRVEIDTRKDLGRKAEEFLKKLSKLNAINIIKPFEITVVKNSSLSEMKASRTAKKVKKEMVLNWALKQTMWCSDKCDNTINELMTLVKERKNA